MENKQSQSFVMSNEVIGSAFHEENKNMKFIEKESDFVWQDMPQVNLVKVKIAHFKVEFL
jgi:hypothetical protein